MKVFAFLIVFLSLCFYSDALGAQDEYLLVQLLNIENASDISWSHDASLIAILKWGSMVILDAETLEEIRTIPDVFAYDMAWHPTENLIATVIGGNSENIEIWNAETGEREVHIERDIPRPISPIFVRTVAWDETGNILFSDAVFDHLIMWDVKRRLTVPVLGNSDQLSHSIISLNLNESGELLISAGDDMMVRVFDIQSREQVMNVSGYKFGEWHPDGVRFAVADHDYGHTVKVWNVDTGKLERILYGHTRAITAIDWHHTEERILSSDADGSVFLWDLESGTARRIDIFDEAIIMDARWRPGFDQFAIVTQHDVYIFDL